MNKLKNVIILVIGRTASGKDTLTRFASEFLDIPILCSYTDRPMRDGEVNGREHWFVKKSAMDWILEHEEIIAKTEINGHRYCVCEDNIRRDVCFYVIDPNGVKDIYEKFGDEYFMPIIMVNTPECIRMNRYVSRGGSVDEFNQRNANESAQFDAFDPHEYDPMAVMVENNANPDVGEHLFTEATGELLRRRIVDGLADYWDKKAEEKYNEQHDI